MVITSLTRNQVVEQSAREFESHRLRQQQSRVNQGFTRVFFCLFVVPDCDKSGSNGARGALFCGARLILCYTLYTRKMYAVVP